MNEKRQYLRVPVESATFVELEAPGMNKNEAGRVVACKSLDVSRGGLQVVLEEQAILGAILQIGVAIPGSHDTIYLVGDVRWCIPDQNAPGAWLCGFQLMNANDSDIKSWIELITILE
ncbi:PilZ domain-containing protein [Halioglobus sp.]|nr:PilZ domain-containing protein [Halioglobus sp.]